MLTAHPYGKERLFWRFSFFMDTELNGPAQAFKFSAGLKQQFPVEAAHLNLAGFAREDLTSKREDFYPIVIAIESIFPTNPAQDKVKKSI